MYEILFEVDPNLAFGLFFQHRPCICYLSYTELFWFLTELFFTTMIYALLSPNSFSTSNIAGTFLVPPELGSLSGCHSGFSPHHTMKKNRFMNVTPSRLLRPKGQGFCPVVFKFS